MKPYRLLRCRTVAGACVLVLAGLSSAAAQFPPPPGQTQNQPQSANPGGVFPAPPGGSAPQQSVFPPPSGQAPAQQSAFPPPPVPGQASAPSSAFPSPGQMSGPGTGFPNRGGGSFVQPGGTHGGGPPPAVPEAQKICMTFPAIREEVEKGAAAIKAAGDRKASREEVCPLFKNFVAKEARMVKFLEANRVACGVPAQVIPQAKQAHAKSTQIRNVVCSQGGGGGPAPAPSLSDVLGGPVIADDQSVKQPGRGTFDTLTGNALQR